MHAILTALVLYHAERARGPGGQPLAKVLPAMALTVMQIVLEVGKKIFDAGEYGYETRVQAGYQQFVMYIAYTISDIAVLVSEEGKSGGCVHMPLRAISRVGCSIKCLLTVLHFHIVMLALNAQS